MVRYFGLPNIIHVILNDLGSCAWPDSSAFWSEVEMLIGELGQTAPDVERERDVILWTLGLRKLEHRPNCK